MFCEGGVASRWRPATRTDAINGYAYWLRFLADNDPAALRLGPGERATSGRLHDYARTLMSRMTAMGAVAALGHLALALRAIAPSYDSTNLRTIQNSIQRHAKPRDKRAKLVAGERLVQLGSDLMVSAMGDGEVQDLRAYRDGLLISILAFRPLRVGNLSGMRVDRHVEVHGDKILLRIPAEETKNRQLLECWLPQELAGCFGHYLTEVRPRFLHADRHRGLWPSGKGCPLTTNWVRQIVIRRTKAAFGHGINPHLFRDIAATTLALARPDQALLARDLLGHSRFDTTEEHYLHARTADAGRAYARRIDALRKTHQ